MFKWNDDCPGCQIENECPCMGNPHNSSYKLIDERIHGTVSCGS